MIAQFEEHTMSVLHDSELYRHLRCRVGGSGHMGFDLVTYPMHLVISGDMGTYVFSRVHDMLKFFRGHEAPNLGYWSEKVESLCKTDGMMQWSKEKFRENLQTAMEDCEDADVIDQVSQLLDEVEDYSPDELLSQLHKIDSSRFGDFYEFECMDYTYRFQWCCWAILWAIRQYDAAKPQPQPTPETAK